MVQLRDDVLDEVTHLYFERRRLQIELLQNPPKDVNKFIERELRLQELTADIDAMTGGYLSREIKRRKNNMPAPTFLRESGTVLFRLESVSKN